MNIIIITVNIEIKLIIAFGMIRLEFIFHLTSSYLKILICQHFYKSYFKMLAFLSYRRLCIYPYKEIVHILNELVLVSLYILL